MVHHACMQHRQIGELLVALCPLGILTWQSNRPFPSMHTTCPYSWPSSLYTSSRFSSSFSFFPRFLFFPPFPLFFGIARADLDARGAWWRGAAICLR